MARPTLIFYNEKTHFLPGSKALVTMSESPSPQISSPTNASYNFTDKDGKQHAVVKWGEDNDFPAGVLSLCEKSPIFTSGMLFNINTLFGDGVVYGQWVHKENGQSVFVRDRSVKEINEFLSLNDIDNYILEQANDLCWFANVFPEVILNKKKKIVELRHKEAAFSRWGEMNKETGLIENHYYCARWSKKTKSEQIDVTPVLSPFRTVEDLQIRMGLLPGHNGQTRQGSQYRFIIPLNVPSPGKNYYQTPHWYSIVESGWLDYSLKIPEFKTALLENQMIIKYHVELSDDYFDKIYAAEGISDPEKKQARIKKEYNDLNKFLTSVKNTGKTVVSFIRYDAQGRELRRMKIHVIENKLTGGEYIEDSEEASNIISYALGVHPALIGSSPGKNKSISGSEARELFIIKQSMQKAIRSRLLRPLYIIRDFNGWPKDIDFAIPNTTLKTLDSGTGSEKTIS